MKPEVVDDEHLRVPVEVAGQNYEVMFWLPSDEESVWVDFVMWNDSPHSWTPVYEEDRRYQGAEQAAWNAVPDPREYMASSGRVTPRPVTEPLSASDRDLINRHRRSLGMGPIDLGAGWTTPELKKMADAIRTTGRMGNPVQVLKRRLMR